MFKTAIKEFHLYVFGHLSEVVLPEKLKNADEGRKNKILNSKRNRKKQLFKRILNNPVLSNKFRVALRHVQANKLEMLLYGDHTSDLSEIKNIYSFPSDEEIQKKLLDLNQQYGSYLKITPTLSENFLMLFKMCKLTADFIEDDSSQGDALAFEHAYKMMVFFGIDFQDKDPFDVFETYIKSLNFESEGKQVHYALVSPLAQVTTEQETPDLKEWQALIKKAGKDAIRLFQRASDIEAILTHAPNNLEEAISASSKLRYKRADENVELAGLALQHNVPEYIFNKCLDVYARRKKSDTLPNIHIDGKTIAALRSLKMKGQPADFHLHKLPIDDPRFLIMGYITGCCQSIGGDSERCVIDGGTLENNGFYVLLKRTLASKQKSRSNPSPYNTDGSINYQDFEITGVGYFWRGRYHNFVFDSWENSHTSKYDLIVAPMLKALAKKIVETDKNALRVTIGTGGKTPKALKNIPVSPSPMLEGYQYPDSGEQSLLHGDPSIIDKQLQPIKEQLKKILSASAYESLSKFITFNYLYSQSHIELLQDILKISVNMQEKERIHYLKQLIKHFNISMELKISNLLSSDYLQKVLTEIKRSSNKIPSFMRNYIFNKLMCNFITALSILNTIGRLNNNNFIILAENVEYSRELTNAISTIHQVEGLETELDQILKYPKYADTITNGMIIFHKSNQLNKTTRSLLIKNRENADIFSKAYLTLSVKQQQLLNTQFPKEFWQALLILNAAEIKITDSFFNALLEKANSKNKNNIKCISETFYILNKIERLTTKVAQACLIENPDYPWEINRFMEGISQQRPDLLTIESICAIIKNLKRPTYLYEIITGLDILSPEKILKLLPNSNAIQIIYSGLREMPTLTSEHKKQLRSDIDSTFYICASIKLIKESETLKIGKYLEIDNECKMFKLKQPTDAFFQHLIKHFQYSKDIAYALLAFENSEKMTEDNISFLFDHPECAKKIAKIDLNTNWQKAVLSDNSEISELK